MKRFPHLGSDLLASVVVFLVALPLCMGIALASGMPPAAGLVSGIIGGLVVGFLGGSPLQVSGPAAGLAVIVFDLVQRYGVEGLAAVIVGAGLLQLAAGLFGLGRWFKAVSPSVIYGMLAGIGVLILASQIHVMVDDAPRSSGLANLLAIPQALWWAVVPHDATPQHHLAAAMGLLTLLSLLAWNAWRPTRLAAVPGPLVGVVTASAAAWALGMPIKYVSVPDNILAALPMPGAATFTDLLRPELLLAALALSFIASAETLLSAAAVDRMQNGPRTRYDQELVGQGVGNLLCGLVGALPITGVIVRSSANVSAGGRTRASAILHGVWLLALVVLFPQVLNLIPLASLAAVLVYVGFKLVDLKVVKKLREFGRFEVAVYCATLGGVVLTDLLTGVLIGLGLSVARVLYVLSHLDVRLEDRGADRYELYLHGAATFLTLPRLSEALEAVPAGAEVHLHMADLAYVDHACIEALGAWEDTHRANGGMLVAEWTELLSRARQRRPRPVAAPGVPA